MQASQASPFKPGGDLPNPLPPGAHRVISDDDRGPDAQDDGRRGALRHRQAGAAQRLLFRRQDRHRAEDRSRHAYSIRRPCTSPRSPAFAPVNNPVIAVAVVIDNPKGASTTAPQSPRRCLPKWRSRCSNTWACRTTSMCSPPKTPSEEREARSQEDDAADAERTSTRSMPQPTICPADDPLRDCHRRSLHVHRAARNQRRPRTVARLAAATTLRSQQDAHQCRAAAQPACNATTAISAGRQRNTSRSATANKLTRALAHRASRAPE